MKKIIISITFLSTFVFGAIYGVGDYITEQHQNVAISTCYSGNGYDEGDLWKLSDWNGEVNGGNYNVIVIIMGASWWGACHTGHNGPAGELHHEYLDNENVKFLVAFADPGQPYSCAQWGNMPSGGGSQIVLDENVSPTIWSMFNTGNAYPSSVFITHDMKVHDMMNNAGSWSINNRIDAMLEECGSECDPNPCANVVNGDLNNDGITNISDIILTISYILYDNQLDCIPDVNQDGIVNVSDIVSITTIILE